MRGAVVARRDHFACGLRKARRRGAGRRVAGGEGREPSLPLAARNSFVWACAAGREGGEERFGRGALSGSAADVLADQPTTFGDPDDDLLRAVPTPDLQD